MGFEGFIVGPDIGENLGGHFWGLGSRDGSHSRWWVLLKVQ